MPENIAAYAKYEAIASFGETMNPMQVQYIHSPAPIRAIFKGNQGGGCLKKDTLIPLQDGSLKKIQDILAGDVAFAVDEHYRIVRSIVKERIDSGIQSSLMVTTKSGRQVTATPCHPFLTINGWKPIREIAIGDYIAVPRTIPANGDGNHPEWQYKILGYLIGDGHIVDSACISNLDKKIIDEIKDMIPRGLSLKHIQAGDYRISSDGKTGYGRNEIVNLLRDTGLWGTNSYTKFIPEMVYCATDHNIGLFLSRLFSCDGWIDDSAVGYASVSYPLISGVQSLLLRLGILSIIRAKKNHHWGTNSKRTDERVDYSLCIKRLSDIARFSVKVGIFSKQEKLDSLLRKRSDEIPKENSDIIPLDVSYLLDRLPRKKQNNNIQGTDWVYEGNNLYHLYRQARGNTITRRKAKPMAVAFDDARLLDLATSDILWDKVSNIIDIGECQTYDLEMEDTHNFIANNIFAHNTAVCMYDVALRLMGIHPVQARNVLSKPIRLVSKVVPEGPDDQNNQQYVELKRFLGPLGIIKKDITARGKLQTVRDLKGGADKQVEYMASTQELDAFMALQRSGYYQDEEIERIKWDESTMRLLKPRSSGESADTSVSVTPARGLDWMFDSIWKKASRIYRSDTICKKFSFPTIEETGAKPGVECFCWATDDNPALTIDTINGIMEGIDDPDEEAMRRYGVFRQVSGRIYKAFDERIHKISADEYFRSDVFRGYWNYRIIDYHPSKPWDVSFVVIDPHNEWFVWNEIHQSHDNRTTYELRDEIKSESLLGEDEEFNRCTLIDPLSNMKQIRPDATTGRSVFDDLMSGPRGLRRLTPADTKNSPNGGRMNIKMRLKNAALCGKPGNNLLPEGEPEDPRYGYYRPTLWFMDNCRHHIEHFKNWRTVDHVLERTKATKVVKRESEKWSDFCRNLEFLGSVNPVWWEMHQQNDNYWESRKRFQGQRMAVNG